jgi:hypothetical protein
MPTDARIPRADPHAAPLHADRAPAPSALRGQRVQWLRWLPWLPVGLALAWVVSLLVRTLSWPLINDACMNHYVGWQIAEGATPYRDVFDFQFPGTLFIHAAVVRLFGAGDAVWRAFDLAWLAAACWLFVRFHRRSPGWVAGASAALYVHWHVALGAWNTGQRDFIQAVLLLGCALAAVNAIEGRRPERKLLLAGLMAGAAAAIKPQAILFALLLAPILAWAARGRASARLARFAAGIAAVPIALAVWLAWTGGLSSFVEIVRDYLVPLHPRMNRLPPGRIALSWIANPFSLPLVLLGLLALARAAWTQAMVARRLVLVAGCVYGVAHLALQAKGWSYHFEPAALFLCALAPAALEPVRGRRAWLGTALLVLASALAFRAFLVVAPRALAQIDLDATRAHRETVDAAMADIRELAPAARRVQVFESGPAGIEALLRLRLRQSARFVYNHPLLIAPESAATQRLRAEFLADLRRTPPELLLVFGYAAETGQCADMASFPELAALIDEEYRLLRDRGHFRVFVPRR